MGHGFLAAAADNIDFMIHGIFSYELFGQTLWITTTHVSVLIVMLLIIIFSCVAGRMAKKAKESAVNDADRRIAECVLNI